MRKMRKGFTLVEILIVVVILGILAAIVIPQFSEASTEARTNSVKSSLQTLRSQISLYKVQHNDTVPTLANFGSAMIGKTDQDGTINASGAFGPYLQSVPLNPFTNGDTVGSATTDDWVYTDTTGVITAGYGGSTAINGSDGLAISTY